MCCISLISTSKPPTIYARICACRAIGRKIATAENATWSATTVNLKNATNNFL